MMSFHDLTDHLPIEDDDFENWLRGKSPAGIPFREYSENLRGESIMNLIMICLGESFTLGLTNSGELTGTMVILRDTVRI